MNWCCIGKVVSLYLLCPSTGLQPVVHQVGKSSNGIKYLTSHQVRQRHRGALLVFQCSRLSHSWICLFLKIRELKCHTQAFMIGFSFSLFHWGWYFPYIFPFAWRWETAEKKSQQHMYVPNPLWKEHGCETEREGDLHLQNLTKGAVDVWWVWNNMMGMRA